MIWPFKRKSSGPRDLRVWNEAINQIITPYRFTATIYGSALPDSCSSQSILPNGTKLCDKPVSMRRPFPPAMPVHTVRFIPDQDGLGAWARKNFIEAGTPLHNPEHAHLQDASIGWLWTNGVSQYRGKRFAGEAKMPRDGGSRWSQMMATAQLEDWFGTVPDFLITIDAELAAEAGDAAFCALIEHELLHCAQDVDVLGMPRFSREGTPVFAMRGHDVEQFVSVVARYGAQASGVQALVEAARSGPGVQDGAIGLACGTCGARKAA